MNADSSWRDTLDLLLDKLCTDGLTDDEQRQLNDLLRIGVEQRRYYRQYLRLHAAMKWNARKLHEGEYSLRGAIEQQDATLLPQASSSVFGLPSFSFRNAAGYFSDGWPLAYLLGTIFFAAALGICSLITVTHHRNVAQRMSAAISELAKAEANAEFVGKVTGMIDVRWADVQTSTVLGANVFRGRKFSLASGLMEVTYQTGAKVLLQGPATYEVESRDSGYLSHGRLTARLEKKRAEKVASGHEAVASGQWLVASKQGAGFSGQGSEVVNQKSEIKNHKSLAPMFAVRTPTLTVTDLGTEFDVNVQESGAVEVSVTQGIVETSRISQKDKSPIKERYVAGDAVRFASAAAAPVRITATKHKTSIDGLMTTVHKARQAAYLKPANIVASSYGRIWDANGKKLAVGDRRQAFLMATDLILGRGLSERGPRSSVDTYDSSEVRGQGSESANQKSLATDHRPLTTSFVGLLYDRQVRIDRIKICLGWQTPEGGSWREPPRLFILKNRVDTNQTRPENDPADWREVPLHAAYGGSFDSHRIGNAGKVIELVISQGNEKERTGYGWALGGSAADGTDHFLSVTELYGFGEELKTK